MSDDRRYIKAATDAIKEVVTVRELYLRLHGREPNEVELKQLVNRLNPARSNPGADILAQWLEVLPELHGTPVAEFFKLKGSD